ncbi:unnamed protein product [Dicrocoelium dendriticum]|nr:unnamed protein product [Dicrocoelium dendriticum]
MERAQRLELENAKLKHRICEVDYYKARCDQLAGDLEAMVEQQSESPAARNGESDTRCTLLEELNKTRMKLADVEKLRSIDLDEMTKLREELGKLRLEQCTLISKNSSKKLALFGSIPEQLFRSNRHLSSKDASDSETSECSSAMRPEPTAPNLSVQLQESVTLPLTSNRTKHNHASWSATELTDTGTPLPEVEAIGRYQSEKSQSQRNDPVKRPAKLRNWRAFRRSLRSEHCDGRGASDDDMNDGDDDDERDEAEGVDSGNSTGNSTEGASIGKLPKGRIQPAPDHHHHRRLKSIACSDSESVERESEAEYLNTSNDHLKQQFGTTGVHLSENEQKIGVLKTNLQPEVALDYNEKSNMRIQPANSKTGLELSEHTGHLGTHASEYHPNSKETNDALVSRKPHLESQTSNAEVAQQANPKEQPTRPGEMEASLLGLSRQISVEKQMSAVLQEQLVAEKIKTEQQLTILNGIRTGFLLMGFNKGNIDRILHHDSNVNHADLLIQLLEEYRRSESTGHQITEDTNQSLGRGTSETPTFSTASVIRRVTTEPQNQASDQHCIQGADEVDASDCALSLGMSKDGFIQQASENEKRDANNSPQIVNERFEQTILAVNKQLVSSQNHVAGLITTNARLQVENATLHSQVDSLSAQNAFLSGRTAELKIEANRLKSMLDEAHTAEAEISSDYKHLQNLYERLTMDYDAMNEALQESKETQRRLKHRLGEASAELSHLQSTSKEVRVLKDALEVERDAFKGGVKQSVHLQEDCSRLRLQIESLAKERDRERSEKSIMAEKMREDRRKIEELQNKMNELTFELTDQRDNDRKCRTELESLRSRIQTLSNRNSKLEEENRTFIIQFEALLGQNQEPFPTKTALFSNHLTEVGLIRDRLFSPQRHKQHLEDKLMQHYRNGSQSKKPQRRITLVQKARAALTKRKELEPVVRRSSDARDRTNSMQSQCQFSNENDGLFANSLAASEVMTTPNAAPVPGSVSLYDQDENKLSTNKYQTFLRCLDNSTLNAKTEAMGPRRQDASGYPSTCVLDSDFRQSWCPERPSEETSLATVHGAINSNGASELAEAPHRTKVPKSSSYQVDSGHQFPIEPTESRSFHGTKFRGTPSQICLNATGCEPRDSSESTEAKSKQRGSQSCGGQVYRKLPATDRCEKHLFEVVTIKSTCENLIASVHSHQGSKVSRSSSMRSFSPSHNANSGKIVERANSPLCNFPSEDHGKEKRFDHSLPHMRRPEKLKHQESGIRGNEDGWKSDSLSSLRFTRSKSSMSSHLSSYTNDTTEQNHNGSSNGHSTVESIRSLEVESKPRVLLEYGDL